MNQYHQDKHPARIESLIEALRKTEEGEGIAEGLEFLFNGAASFQLRMSDSPRDEWVYLYVLYQEFSEDRNLCDQVFTNAQQRSCSGRSWQML